MLATRVPPSQSCAGQQNLGRGMGATRRRGRGGMGQSIWGPADCPNKECKEVEERVLRGTSRVTNDRMGERVGGDYGLK